MEVQSLGRFRPHHQPARSHIVYTDQRGRKIPHADRITSPEPTIISVRENNDSNENNNETRSDSILEIYGWRKKCLYILIISMLFMIIINLILTMWILKVLDFNLTGMGQLRIVPSGLQLLGQALVMDSLITSSIKTRRGQTMAFESSRNFTIRAKDDRGVVTSSLYLGHDRLECETSHFVIKDSKGKVLMSAKDDHLTLGAETVTVTGEGGTVVEGSVQTPSLRAPPRKQLILESPTRSLEIRAAHKITLESRAGTIHANCLRGIRLQSVVGAIHLDAPNVYLPKLKSALPLPPPSQSSSHSRDQHHHDIYQLCVCSNGKLFLAPPHGICAVREDSHICR